MKYLKQNALILFLTISSVSIMNSCSSYELDEDELTSFMLGGIYFIDGYGGMDELVDILVNDENLTDDEELLVGYELYLQFPFDHTQATESASYLVNYWDITNKTSLFLQMEELKNKEHNHKAWDYARMVDIAAQGYSAKYLTKDEVREILTEILPLARAKYDTWEDYYDGYNAGLKAWDAESEQVILYGKLSHDILTHEKSIYNLIPLNP